MISAFTTDLFNSSFQNFKYTGAFGLFKTNKYILFQIEDGIDLNILGIIPAIILGVVGGLMGYLFISLNLKLARLRDHLVSKIPNNQLVKVLQMTEPMLIILIYTSLSILLPALFSCTPMSCIMQLGRCL